MKSENNNINMHKDTNNYNPDKDYEKKKKIRKVVMYILMIIIIILIILLLMHYCATGDQKKPISKGNQTTTTDKIETTLITTGTETTTTLPPVITEEVTTTTTKTIPIKTEDNPRVTQSRTQAQTEAPTTQPRTQATTTTTKATTTTTTTTKKVDTYTWNYSNVIDKDLGMDTGNQNVTVCHNGSRIGNYYLYVGSDPIGYANGNGIAVVNSNTYNLSSKPTLTVEDESTSEKHNASYSTSCKAS